MEEEMEILEKLVKDCEWVNENYDKFQKYQGEIIAIKGKEIIAVQDDLEALLNELENKNENSAFLLIEAIPPEGVSFIL